MTITTQIVDHVIEIIHKACRIFNLPELDINRSVDDVNYAHTIKAGEAFRIYVFKDDKPFRFNLSLGHVSLLGQTTFDQRYTGNEIEKVIAEAIGHYAKLTMLAQFGTLCRDYPIDQPVNEESQERLL
jgi:hypothetical protein